MKESVDRELLGLVFEMSDLQRALPLSFDDQREAICEVQDKVFDALSWDQGWREWDSDG